MNDRVSLDRSTSIAYPRGMPELLPLSKQQRTAWWSALLAMARTDGEFNRQEKASLAVWAGRLKVDPNLHAPAILDAAALGRAFRSDDHRIRLFDSLTAIATCDGDYCDAEDSALNRLALAWWPPDPEPLGKLTSAQARALWVALCAVAFCDGVVSGRERHLLANWRTRLQIPERPDRVPGRGLDELASAFDSEERRTAVIELLLELATCDGALNSEEREVIDDLTRRWKLTLPR